MKNQFLVIPNTLALTTGIIYVLCRVLVGLFPGVSVTIVRSWFHSIDFVKPGAWDTTASSFILGLISSVITAWVVGYIFISVRKMLVK
ncbi:MAG: hypothetical protein UV83_C0006G0031 [candidate division WWE3 bacterium GW2011_GWE2_43_18]|nr:hypothetical protein P147_WWE3C00001G0754 [candidate division WWE3 bacterium RAAC2_WWE3_1]KKS29180.1 MAG: hypothetical protein UU91_C0008G0044 [candidate division WWE3 bacterium GW2011_GWB1_42_117]KKS54753.1 MAG: hypothetical protein UV21_C0005G0117 [candidate division WWE3 bacterium GW2011_GWD2_42_34]KKT05202.1 MAG: hypothetical protein UV83_C0006G0031 [candidate division WWE3 bacterium GW2011_GWE2_43_18]KKT06469.1 MAG: hypothetical protein UV84_C0007G0031 [candidate division WWE3 bacterium